MKLSSVLCVAVLLAGAIAPVAAWADGAIARGEDGRVGMSWNARGERDAAERAMEKCGRRCRIVGTFRNSCAAVATGDRGGYGWARAERLRRAEDDAIEYCRREGNRGCRIAISGCDDRG